MNDANTVVWYQLHKKETAAAFLFWFFLGHFGAHRFYLGKTGSATAMLVIMLVSIPLCFILIGFISYFAMIVWWIIDAFLICGWVNEHNARVAHALIQQNAGPFQLPPPIR